MTDMDEIIQKLKTQMDNEKKLFDEAFDKSLG